MLDRVLEFNRALRDAGVPVAVSESMDALNALTLVGMSDRRAVKAAMSATMIKNESHRPAFDTLFDLYFGGGPVDSPGGEDDGDPGEFANELYGALTGGEGGALGELARRAVEAFGHVENSPSGSGYFEYPIYRALDLSALAARLETGNANLAPLEARLRRREFDERVRRFRAHVQRDVRARVVARKGPQAVARHALRPLLEDLDLGYASTVELADLARAVRPLARKLATRVALKHKRSRRGRLDVRRTVRHSLSTGGVPFETFARHRAPHRPELFVLCDVSDSVARFARFSLMLVHALHDQFSKVRSFAFTDTIDEVTHLFEKEEFPVAVRRMNDEADVVWLDRHSHYGTSLERFLERYGKDVSARTTLFILGDARNNNRNTKAWALKELQAKAHRTYWLNPEPITYWDSGDSSASEYARYTDRMVEARTLRQLEEFIAEVL